MSSARMATPRAAAAATAASSCRVSGAPASGSQGTASTPLRACGAAPSACREPSRCERQEGSGAAAFATRPHAGAAAPGTPGAPPGR